MQFEFCTEEFELCDLVEFGGVAFSAESVVRSQRLVHVVQQSVISSHGLLQHSVIWSERLLHMVQQTVMCSSWLLCIVRNSM